MNRKGFTASGLFMHFKKAQQQKATKNFSVAFYTQEGGERPSLAKN